jgi:hypothetical protein
VESENDAAQYFTANALRFSRRLKRRLPAKAIRIDPNDRHVETCGSTSCVNGGRDIHDRIAGIFTGSD